LRELAAILAQARIVVAGDSGPLHLAAALGTHVVALFGPTDPARNGPLPRGTVLRNASSEETSHKRVAAYSERMLSLTVDQVLAAAEQEMGVKA
jgi:heptosyltransferase-1